MRRIISFLSLIIVLLAFIKLDKVSDDWHYVVPSKSGELLYVTSFDDTQSWIEDERQHLFVGVKDGVMRLEQRSTSGIIYSAPDFYFGNFDMRVESKVISGSFDGDNQNAYGVLFRQKDEKNYYMFLVSSDGSYRLKRVLNGETSFLSDWIITDSINKTQGSINTIRVIGYEEQFQFFINDQVMLLCIPNNPEALSLVYLGECKEGAFRETLNDESIPYGRLGVAIDLDRGQELIIEFDNVVIVGPESIGEQ